MILAPTPIDESERLADLRALDILDTPPESRFDRIIELAKRTLRAPIAYIALVDGDRQWFKACCGLNAKQTDRDISFCGHAIMSDEPMIVPDARRDPRFADNPLVTGEPFVRFYIGLPLKGPSGHNVGTLCLVDREPREVDENDIAILRRLAEVAENELNLVDLIKVQREMLETKTALVETQRRLAHELNEAAAFVKSKLPANRIGAIRTDYRFISSSQLGGDLLGFHDLDDDHLAVYLFDVTGHGVSAALLSVSVYDTLRNQTLPDVDFRDPSAVLARMNRAYPMASNGNRFFTMWYGVYRRSTRTMRYANGGHPPATLFTRDEARVFDESDLIVGVAPETAYTTHEREIPPDSAMYLYSDGAFEVRDRDGHMIQLAGLRRVLCRAQREANGSRVGWALETIREIQGADAFDDDFSLLEMRFA